MHDGERSKEDEENGGSLDELEGVEKARKGKTS